MNTLSMQYGNTMTTRHPLGDAPIGQQLLSHYARRDAVRHATPLFPSSWAELFAPFRAARLQPSVINRNQPGRAPRLHRPAA
jgi:hypothetical protein